MRPSTDNSVRAARLKLASIFSDLDDLSRLELANIAHFRTLKAREILWKRGDHAYELAFVWSGALAVLRQQPHLKDKVSYRLVPTNDTIGLSNAIGRIPCTVDVIANEPTRVLLLSGDSLRGLIPRRPEIAFEAIAFLGNLVGRLSDEIELLHSGSLEERVVARIRALSANRVEVRVTHLELASQVAARRESVTRALRSLEQSGVIETGRGWIRLKS